MNRSLQVLFVACLASCLAAAASANPELFVNYEGLSGGGNHKWLVSVAPDPDYFSNTTSGFGSSLAVELAFAVQGSTIVPGSPFENNNDWPADNPGNNPFTNTVTDGLWLSPGLDKAFGAFGSNVFLSGLPVPLFGFQTVGSVPTTVHYGVAAAGHPTKGSIIGQTGQNFPVELASFGESLAGSVGGFHQFSGYTGSVNSVPEPAAWLLTMIASWMGLITPPRNRG